MKHTPGPWKVYIDGDGAVCIGDEKGHHSPLAIVATEHDARALLRLLNDPKVVAALQMYESGMAYAEVGWFDGDLRCRLCSCTTRGGYCGCEPRDPVAQERRFRLIAAIRAAEGGSD